MKLSIPSRPSTGNSYDTGNRGGPLENVKYRLSSVGDKSPPITDKLLTTWSTSISDSRRSGNAIYSGSEFFNGPINKREAAVKSSRYLK
ncbi:hypothetical protein GWI33_021402 [Rhynchophorus ferrugineus]|uniref:Uncharacterized protein n=1 Tax=Rhynchophorus ferrugineus TaxID=354439 RepID=A0A834M396_RHYFE|nr:hypothetical protein GWI33_021402 [Rhynchophorus ferrugineus]